MAAAGATTEAARLQALRGTKRDRYGFEVALDAETDVIDLGHIINVTHSRFGLSSGKDFVVMMVEPIANRERLRLEVWG